MNPAQRTAELAALLDGTNITLLSLTENGETITLRRDGGTAPVRSTPAAAAERVVTAPCPGVLLLAHPSRAERLVEPGLGVAAGAVLGLLRIGPMLIEIRSPVAGTLLRAEATEGALVGFGTPLFRLSIDGGAP